MPEPVLVAVKHDGRALGGVAVLVDVGRDLGDAGDPEVPGWDVVAQALEEREHEPADARVDVTGHAVRGGERRELGDRVHDPVGIVERRGDDDRGAVGDETLGGGHVGAVPGVEGDTHDLHVEVVRGLRVGGVRRLGRQDLRTVDAARPGPLAVHEHRHQDRLGAPRGHRAAAAVREVRQRPDHGDDLVLERGELRELERVQRVAEQVAAVDLDDQVLEVGTTARVHEPEQPGSVHGGFEGTAPVEVGEHRVGRQPTVAHDTCLLGASTACLPSLPLLAPSAPGRSGHGTLRATTTCGGNRVTACLRWRSRRGRPSRGRCRAGRSSTPTGPSPIRSPRRGTHAAARWRR